MKKETVWLLQLVEVGGLLAGAFGALSEVPGDLLRAAGASERLAELLSAEPDIRAPASPKSLPEPALGELEFEHGRCLADFEPGLFDVAPAASRDQPQSF